MSGSGIRVRTLCSPALSERVGGQNFRRDAAASFTSESLCRLGFNVAFKCRPSEGYTLWGSARACSILLRLALLAVTHLCTIILLH